MRLRPGRLLMTTMSAIIGRLSQPLLELAGEWKKNGSRNGFLQELLLLILMFGTYGVDTLNRSPKLKLDLVGSNSEIEIGFQDYSGQNKTFCLFQKNFFPKYTPPSNVQSCRRRSIRQTHAPNKQPPNSMFVGSLTGKASRVYLAQACHKKLQRQKNIRSHTYNSHK